MRTAQLLLLLVVSGCRFAQVADPPWRTTVRGFEVHAATEDLGRAVAADIDECLPSLLSLPGFVERPKARVFVFEVRNTGARGLTTSSADFGFSDENRIDLFFGPDTKPEERKHIVAHELVHFLIGPEWLGLSSTMEEGLCDACASELVPDFAPRRRAGVALQLAAYLEGALVHHSVWSGPNGVEPITATLTFAIDGEGLPTWDGALTLPRGWVVRYEVEGQRPFLGALGYLFVSRIGREGLFRACKVARDEGREVIPARRLCVLAGLDPANPRAWMPAVYELLGPRERQVLDDLVERRANSPAGVQVFLR